MQSKSNLEIDRLLDKVLIKETGIRDINKLAKRYPKAEIYFHQDTDGVATAIAMREYLKNNGIETVDSHVIQYGEKEFQVKNPQITSIIPKLFVCGYYLDFDSQYLVNLLDKIN